MGLYYIIIEVDEYTRMFQIHQDFSQSKVGILFIRFYKVDGTKVNPNLSSRLKELNEYMKNQVSHH